MSYFLRHPQALDSVEGVARWRLLEEAVHRNVNDIDEAIRWLVAAGFLMEETAAGTSPLFSLNRERAAEAKRFIEGAEMPGARGKH